MGTFILSVGGGGDDRWTHAIESKGLSHAIRFLFNTLKRVFVLIKFPK